jgi:hypothetical protein
MKELVIGFIIGFMVAYAMKKETVSTTFVPNTKTTPQYSWFDLVPF